MKDLVSACSAGKVDGQVVVDLMKEEDNFGECDLPMAIIPKKGEVVLLQMDGKLSRDEFKEAYKLAYDGCMKVYDLQRKTLMDSMKKFVGEGGIENGD
jgi:exosome complex component RRP41